MKHVQIKIKLDDGATMPTRATDGSVGYDVTCHKLYAVMANGDRLDVYNEDFIHRMIAADMGAIYWEAHTGVHITPADGYYMELVPNSRLAKTKLFYGNSIGIIDQDFTGCIRAIFNGTGKGWDIKDLVKILPGMTIGQLIIRKKYDAVWEQVEELEQTERGEGGFGSTAKQ